MSPNTLLSPSAFSSPGLAPPPFTPGASPTDLGVVGSPSSLISPGSVGNGPDFAALLTEAIGGVNATAQTADAL
ncbi:MAG: hypothetical protein AAF907_11870, partial [Planctomycetota bacterium]